MTKEDLMRLESYVDESLIQHTCVRWFRLTFAKIAKMTKMLWAVPNGGLRDFGTAHLSLDEDYHVEIALKKYPIYRQDV